MREDDASAGKSSVNKPRGQAESASAAKSKPHEPPQTPPAVGSLPERHVETAASRGPGSTDQQGLSAAYGKRTSEFPYLCPGEKYPITRSVCLGRQGRNFDKCLQCEHFVKERRPRKSDFKEK
jgi:hypothetical protein